MHEGHRQRMLERVEKCGLDTLQEHEILEVILFYVIPRKNTNEIAHLLLDKFGTIAHVLEAESEELLTVEGMGPRSVAFLKMIPSILRVYEQSQMKEAPMFDSVTSATTFGKALFRGETKELTYALLLDNKMCKIECVKIATGTLRCVELNLKELFRECINKQVAGIILYHNHPRGIAVPSKEDMETTIQLELKLADVGVTLLEHIIIADSSYYTILKHYKSFSRTYIPNSGLSDIQVEYFYDK